MADALSHPPTPLRPPADAQKLPAAPLTPFAPPEEDWLEEGLLRQSDHF